MRTTSVLTKSRAVSIIVEGHADPGVNSQKLFFANINRRKNVWWIDVPADLLKSNKDNTIGLLLYDVHSRILHHLAVPVSFLRAKLTQLVSRRRKDGRLVLSLELSANEKTLFRDVRPTGGRVGFKSWRHCSQNLLANSVNVDLKKSGAYQKRRRNKRKEDLIKMKGGGCGKCGYDKSSSALVFHHRDEKTKTFNVSGQNLNKHSWERLLEEVRKCDLLCANCHAETHDKEGWVHENGRRTVKNPRMF